MDELSQLVIRAAGGDLAAYGAIVERLQDMAYAYAYSLLGSFDAAEDAAQEAFIDAYRHLAQLREPAAFPGWFRRIVYKHCDRQRRERQADPLPETAAGGSGPAEILLVRELQERVLAAIAALPDNERAVVSLYYMNGYSHKEIATFLEVPVTTVKSRLYTSRKRLRERMLDMVPEVLQSNALPDGFRQETIERLIARAQALNAERKHAEAEQVMREAQSRAPDHPGVLRELNRSVLQNQVFTRGHWPALQEVAEHWQAILQQGIDDEQAYSEQARTLLAIPAMPQALAHIEGWIARKGPGLASLGMLAWAQGCVAQYEAAERIWHELLAMAQQAPAGEVAEALPQAWEALADCFAAAGECERAARVVREAWALYRARRSEGEFRLVDWRWSWPFLFKHVGLGKESEAIARAWLALIEAGPEQGPQSQLEALRARAWLDGFEALAACWLRWVQERLGERDWSLLGVGKCMGYELARAGRPMEQLELNRRTWEHLARVTGDGVEGLQAWWGRQRHNAWLLFHAGDLEGAERVAREALTSGDVEVGYWLLGEIAVARGAPAPPEMMRLMAEKGIEAVDPYGLEGWYLVAREAAAAGERDKAFDALRRANGYWCNPPLAWVRKWEQDARWGALRADPEFQRILDERRQRIGPVYGELHYFPGW